MLKLMRVFVVLAVLGFSSSLCFAQGIGELFDDFQAPEGFVVDATMGQKIVFNNPDENMTMIIVGPIPENESTRVKNDEFARGLIAGLEDTKRIKIKSHEIKSSDGLTLICLTGTADLKGGGEWIPRKSIFISLADSIFELSIYGPDLDFKNTDQIFSTVIKHMRTKLSV